MQRGENTGQGSQKSQKVVIFRPPTLLIRTEIFIVGSLADQITDAKFHVEIFRGYDFTWGRSSHFPIDFCMGLTTVQRYCAACDLSHSYKIKSVCVCQSVCQCINFINSSPRLEYVVLIISTAPELMT